MSGPNLLKARVKALEAPHTHGYRGIVLVEHGETAEEALARAQPVGPYVVVPAKTPSILVQMDPLDREI